MLSRESESFLAWTTMDGDVFAKFAADYPDSLGRFTDEQLVSVWNRAMEYMERDPDTNGSNLEGDGTAWKNFHCYLMAMGMVLGSLYCDRGDLKPEGSDSAV